MLVTMSSSGTPHDHAPFGYAFQQAQGPYPTQQEQSMYAAQPVGPPLLDTSETHFLNHFLDNPDAAFDASNSYIHSDFQPKSDPQQLDFLYVEPPPTVHSVSASLTAHSQSRYSRNSIPQPHHQQHSQLLDSRSNSVPDLSRDDGVYGGASALYDGAMQAHNVAMYSDSTISGRNDSLGVGQGAVMSRLRNGDSIASTSSFNPSLTAHSVAQQPRPGTGDSHLNFNFSPIEQDENPYALFDATAFPPQGSLDNGTHRLYRFGSDAHFTSKGFVPASEPSDEAIHSRLVSGVIGQVFQPVVSAENTRPSSPTVVRRAPTGSISIPQNRNEESGSDEDEEQGARPGKRRKSKHTRNDSDHMTTPTTATSTSFPSRPRVPPTTSQPKRSLPSTKSPIKRRKSSPNDDTTPSSARKPQRENLTEEQKRSNHIQSEQKRRNLIKQGFQQLEILVPELRNGGFSKSNMLVEAGTFLENLINGNVALNKMLGEP